MTFHFFHSVETFDDLAATVHVHSHVIRRTRVASKLPTDQTSHGLNTAATQSIGANDRIDESGLLSVSRFVMKFLFLLHR
jgi:hypothetical protein